MKRIYIILLLNLTLGTALMGSNQIKNRVETLIEEKSFIELNRVLERSTDSIPSSIYLYAKALCYNAFTEYEQSNQLINEILESHKKEFDTKTCLLLLNTQAQNYTNSYEYKKAAEIYHLIITDYKDELEESSLANYKNVKAINKTLADNHIDKQKVHLTHDIKLPIHHNQFNHLMLPVKINSKHDDFIFDTGAMMSTIPESNAKRLGLTIYETDIKVGTSTDIDIRTKLGVADSLYFGDLLVENVVFLVTQDKDLYIEKYDYLLPGIIGFPVMAQLEEIRLAKQSVLIPHTPSTRNYSNLYMNEGRPIVQLINGADTLKMAMDTGAKNTELSYKYFKENKKRILAEGTLKTSQRGGAGGMIEDKTYDLPLFEFQVGSKKRILDQISINTIEYPFIKGLDGNLGQDIFTSFDVMIINLKTMFIDFE